MTATTLSSLRAARTPWLLIAPGLLLAALIIGYPFLDVVRVSLHEVSRFGVMRGWSGLDNFAAVLADPVFVASAWRTLVWTVAVVGGTLLVSLPVALILNEDFIGRGVARTLVMLPWSVSLAMTAVVWRWGFNADYGLVNVLLQQLGVLDGPLQWLASADLAFPIAIGIGILVSIPFTVTILLGGLSAVPGDVYEAARIDGASRWQMFRHLTLPMLRPFLSLAIVLNVIYVFNSFPILWVLTGGGPANGTHILVTYLYELGFRLGRPGEAAAVSLAMLAMLLALIAVYLRMQPKEAEA